MGALRDEIAKNLIFFRKKAGLTQKQLAALIGVKASSVSNWEVGYNSIDIETLHKVCQVLRVPLSAMYGKYANDTTEYNEQTISSDLELTEHEVAVIRAYREKKNMQLAVDTLLGIKIETGTNSIVDDIVETIKTAANSASTSPPYISFPNVIKKK